MQTSHHKRAIILPNCCNMQLLIYQQRSIMKLHYTYLLLQVYGYFLRGLSFISLLQLYKVLLICCIIYSIYPSIHLSVFKAPVVFSMQDIWSLFTVWVKLCCSSEQDAILNDLRVDLALKFNFLFSPTHVEVISGKQEGIYSWIAINHALGRFNHNQQPGILTIILHCFAHLEFV